MIKSFHGFLEAYLKHEVENQIILRKDFPIISIKCTFNLYLPFLLSKAE